MPINGRAGYGSPVWQWGVLRRGFSCFDVMYRGVLDGQGLYGWITLHERGQTRRDFLEKPLVTLVRAAHTRECEGCHETERNLQGWGARW